MGLAFTLGGMYMHAMHSTCWTACCMLVLQAAVAAGKADLQMELDAAQSSLDKYKDQVKHVKIHAVKKAQAKGKAKSSA